MREISLPSSRLSLPAHCYIVDFGISFSYLFSSFLGQNSRPNLPRFSNAAEICLQTVLLDVFPARNPAGAPELVRADVHLVCGAAWVLPGSPEPPPAPQQHRFSAAAAALYVRSGSRRGPSRTARGRRRRDVPAEPAAVSTRRTAVAGVRVTLWPEVTWFDGSIF